MNQYETDREVGQDNNQKRGGGDLHNPVLFFSSLAVPIFVIGTLLVPGPANSALTGARDWAIKHFDWLFIFPKDIRVIVTKRVL